MDFFYGEMDDGKNEITGFRNNVYNDDPTASPLLNGKLAEKGEINSNLDNIYNDNPEESSYIYGKLVKEVAGVEVVKYDGLSTITANTIIDNNDRTIKVNVNTDIIATKEYVDANGGKIDNILLNDVIQPIETVIIDGVEYKKAVNLINVASASDLEDLATDVNASIDEINSNLLVVNTNITNINNDISDLQTEVGNNTSDISDLQDAVSENTSDINDLQDAITDISGDVSGKLDKNTSVTDFRQAYIKNADGTQGFLNIKDSDDSSGSIPVRASYGNLNVPTTPGTNNSATSKSYVDTQVATKGSSLGLSLDSQTYTLTATLYDANGNTLGQAQSIDLPIESLVVSGEYDEQTKSIVLTLQNGQTIVIPLGDLIEGLQTEITIDNKLDADLVDDSTSVNKFVTQAQINQIGTNTQDIADIEIDIENINNDIGNIETDIDSIEGDISTIQGDITQIETDISNITNGATINNFGAVESALADKQDTLIAGNNITIQNNVISADGASLGSVVLEQDLYTYANVGNITNASPLNAVKVADQGDSLGDVWNVLFGQKDEQPTITSMPSLSLSFYNYGGSSQEYGTTITALPFTLNKTTGGYTYDVSTGVSWLNNPIFTLNGSQLTYENSVLNISYVVGTDSSFNIGVSQGYSDGNIATTLLGNQSNPIVQILASTATASRTFSVSSVKFAYYGVNNSSNLPIDANNKCTLTKRSVSGTSGTYTFSPSGQYIWLATSTQINSITWNGNLLTEGVNEDYTYKGSQTIKLDTNATTTYYFYMMNGTKTGTYTYVIN